MYKILILSALIFLMPLSAFSQNNDNEILIYAGAGMRVPLIEIGKTFEKNHGIKVIYDFAGSGRLGNKILIGQKPDLFIPGSDKWAKILIKKGYINNYQPIAYHTPVIITPKGNSKINAMNDFIQPDTTIALGDIKAAAIGAISSKIFRKASIDESAINIKARGVTVKQLVLWVEGNNVDGAIVWRADAIQSKKVRMIHIPDQYNVTNSIPLCTMTGNKKPVADFANYLLGPEGKATFKKYGFKTVAK